MLFLLYFCSVFGCSALLVLAYAVLFYVGIMSTFLKLQKKAHSLCYSM